jgi:apolipoprotein N-acyltransferase
MTGPTAPWYRHLPWLVLAVVGGVLWAWQFERQPLLLAPWMALVPLLLLLDGPRPGWLAFAHGLAFWLASIPWIAATLVTYGQLPAWLSWLLLGLVCAYLALWWALFASVGARWWRAGGWRALVLLPALWVAVEWLRGWLLTGFPWNLAAYAWIDVAGALPLASWIGPWGLSLLVVLANVGAGQALARRRWRSGALALLVPLVLLPVAGRFASGGADGDAAPAALLRRPGPPQPVRVLQPNIANQVSYEPVSALTAYRRVLAMSRDACDVPGALVVWPESAGWPFSYPADPAFAADLRGLVRQGCPLLFNTSLREGEEWRNAAFVLAPGGAEARYDKRHLVPFGEYVPLAPLFPFLDRLARNAGDFTPAEELALLDWGAERLGVAICFEVTFPGEVAEAVRAGATTLVTITNDAWYGASSAPWQHYRAARFRAAENRRPMVRAAITGVSALVAADGSVEAELGIFEQGTLRGRVRGNDELTPYARAPWLVPALCCAVAGAAALRDRLRRRRR